MSRRTRHREIGLVRGLVLLAALGLVVAALDVAEHFGLLILTVALITGAFCAGRRYERRKPRLSANGARPWRGARNTPAATTMPFSVIPAGPDPADQIRQLEQLAGRPMDAILASYRRVARYHRGGQP